MRINHNLAALNAWRNINKNSLELNKTLEKLSSGLRINRAGDDAAGLAISEKMRGQIRGLRMAIKNAQDAISMIQTAEGALNEVHSILQRMRELAVEAASDTNTDVDRSNLQKEVNQLLEEVDRIARATEFNTKKLLDGTLEIFRDRYDSKIVTGGNFQLKTEDISMNTVAAGTGIASYSVDLKANDNVGKTYNVVILGNPFELTLKSSGSDQVYYDLKFNGVSLATGTATGGYAALDVGGFTVGLHFTTSMNTLDNISVTVKNDTAFDSNNAPEGTYVVEVGQFKGSVTSPLDVRVVHSSEYGEAAEVVSFSDGQKDYYGASLKLNGNTLELNSLYAIRFKWRTDVYNLNDFGNALPIEEVVDSGVARVEGVNTSGDKLIFQIGANEGQNMVAGIDKMDSASLGLTKDSVNLTTQNGAERAIMVIDGAIHKVSEMRAQLGAFQNRLEHTIANLGVASENLTAAESRIRDADMAKEMMNFTKEQILVQSAMTMLAQANTLPQNVLQLLRG